MQCVKRTLWLFTGLEGAFPCFYYSPIRLHSYLSKEASTVVHCALNQRYLQLVN